MTLVQLQLKFKLKNEEEMKEELKDFLENHKRLKPVRFGYTTGYAEALEYGTGPLSQLQPTVHDGDYSYKTIYDEIYNWAGKKDGKGSGLPIKDKEERARFAKAVTDKFFAVGMRPHPYWRPAINFLIDNQQRLFNEGKSLMDIASEALRVSDKCIQDQNLPFSGNLQLSAIVEELDVRLILKAKELGKYEDDERNTLYKKSKFV